VVWKKHRGLWRYLNRHPEPPWPGWSRLLWWVGIHGHALLIAPLARWRHR
jgi:hypothetical protein